MYSYKINNSYTVYVNYAYLNDCIKACQKVSKHHSYGTSAKPSQNKNFTPLPQNTMLKHKQFGFGKVVTTDKSGVMYVAFEDKTIRFLYPDAIRKGYLIKVH